MIQQPERRVWPWYTWAIAIVAVAMLLRVALGLWNTFAPAKPAENVPATTTSGAATQTNEGDQVTIKAT
jgi:hypothetical protein